jgi:hypothetical protein
MRKMVKVQADTLTGLALDFMVAQIEGESDNLTFDGEFLRQKPAQMSDESVYSPSTDPEIGHAIIEREKLGFRYVDSPGHKFHGLWLVQECKFRASSQSVDWSPFGKSYAELNKGYVTGPTMLIAAMRYLVCARLGVEVEVPRELLGK